MYTIKIDKTRMNFLIVNEEANGVVKIDVDRKTAKELAEVTTYWECEALKSLGIGESILMDGGAHIVRIY